MRWRMDELEETAVKHLPLTETTYCILAGLASPGHGYAVMQRVGEATSGRIRLGPGTLYGALTNLQRQGLIARIGERDPAGERRKLYALTERGRMAVRMEGARLEELIRVGRKLTGMKGEIHG